MKIAIIIASLALSVIVKGNLLAAAARAGIEPVILSVGAAFAALGLNSQRNHDVNHFEWNKFLNVPTE